jgi:hypothetical protein
MRICSAFPSDHDHHTRAHNSTRVHLIRLHAVAFHDVALRFEKRLHFALLLSQQRFEFGLLLLLRAITRTHSTEARSHGRTHRLGLSDARLELCDHLTDIARTR